MPALDDHRYELFCHEYLKEFNADRAAIGAGFATGYGWHLLQREEIQSRLKELSGEILKKVGASVESVVLELHRIASSDLVSAFDERNCLKPLVDIPEDIRRCIASIEIDEIWEGYGENRTQTGITKKIKLWDKNKGLEMLGKYFKMFVDRTVHEVGESLEALLTQSWGKKDGKGS